MKGEEVGLSLYIPAGIGYSGCWKEGWDVKGLPAAAEGPDGAEAGFAGT